jgi:KDO2-lipid IV(A) lauroyltransferase
MRDPGADRFLARVRKRLGVGVLRPASALAAARRALASGDVVALPIDQVPDHPRGARAPRHTFLGQKAWVDRAPAVLAYRAKATVLVVASERTGDGNRVRLLARITPPTAEARPGAWIDDAIVRSTAALDAFVRRSPEAWFWLHRRWRAPL